MKCYICYIHINHLFLTTYCKSPSFVDSFTNVTLQMYFILCRFLIKFHYNWWPNETHTKLNEKINKKHNFNAIADSYDWMWKKNRAVASKMMRFFSTVSYTCRRQHQRLAKQLKKMCSFYFILFLFSVSLFNLCLNGSCNARMSVFACRQWFSHLLINILQWFE